MSLKGKKIAICASRKALDISEKIISLGGRPFVEDIVKMEYVPEEEVRDALIESLSLRPHFFLFTTGEGTESVFKVAQKYSIFEPLKEVILKGSLFARGYKTRKALLKYGFESFHTVETTEGFKDLLKEEDIKRKMVFLQMYGEELPDLERYVYEAGGKIIKIWVYRYVPDMERMEVFINKLLKGFYDGVLFTSAFHVRWLFVRAKEKGLHKELSRRMSKELTIVSVGRTTAKALFENGVIKVIIPEGERLSLAIKELIKAFENG
ncbi:MAG: uroporphyrinogen-III synthase [Aquificaceae bacterium]